MYADYVHILTQSLPLSSCNTSDCTAYFCFSDYSLASAAQQFGVGTSLPSTAAAAIAAQAAQAAQAAAVAQASPTAAAQAAAVQAAAASSGGAPGKARSSMSLQLMSGR